MLGFLFMGGRVEEGGGLVSGSGGRLSNAAVSKLAKSAKLFCFTGAADAGAA